VAERLESAVGQSLIAIGLYTVAFESMVLSFRGGMHGYLKANDPGSFASFLKACDTADKTFKFCAPKLVNLGVIEDADVRRLNEMRKRRNTFAHEGYDEMMSLTVSDVEPDVLLMLRIARKVERWMPAQARRDVGGTGHLFSISPAIFGMYMQVARKIAHSKLPLEQDDVT
jgi:hypothetical protein